MDPAAPGAYEWWYFDALSVDNRQALVVIFFLGAPMSPYYRAVAAGKEPEARHWCGVFVSLHERRGTRWRERAYAYNLYGGGVFSVTGPGVTVGGSCLETMTGKGGRREWRLAIDEPGLWRGGTQARLSFSCPGPPPLLAPMGDASTAHTWVLAAPVCRVEGSVTLPEGAPLSFSGQGYHDHNFGALPFGDIAVWYWGRAALACDDGIPRSAVFYYLCRLDGGQQSIMLLFGPDGAPLFHADNACPALWQPTRSAYGLRHWARLCLGAATDGGAVEIAVHLPANRGALSEGPFYRRLSLSLQASEQQEGRVVWSGQGEGIGEFFQPAKLCGPVVSRAMWSRIRRRSAP